MKPGIAYLHPRFFKYLIIIIIALFLKACVSEPDNTIILPVDDYYSKLAQGWIEFDARQYEEAIVIFSEASEIDPLRYEAYLGLGWAYAMTDQMSESLYNLDQAVAISPSIPDAYAAKAFILLVQSKHDDAIFSAKEAISLGGNEYMFSSLPCVSAESLRLLLAECYYVVGQYQDAQAQIDILKPDNQLEPENQNYKTELLLEIEKLSSVETVLDELTN